VFRRRAIRVSPTVLSACHARVSLVLSTADSVRLIRYRCRRRFRAGRPGCPCRFARGGRFSRSRRLGRRSRLDRNEPTVVVAESDETEGQRSARGKGCESDQQAPLRAGRAFSCHWDSSLCVRRPCPGAGDSDRPRRPAP
jgi:hypothetical protein